MGDVQTRFQHVINRLKDDLKTQIKQSPIYRTKPWGPVPQDDFLNQVIELESTLSPLALLDYLQFVESEFGRTRDVEIRWGPRSIDLDILSWTGTTIDDSHLVVPHPFLAERQFVLKPFVDLAPEHKPPGFTQSVKDLLKTCADSTDVELL
mgnify:CR=1 FL=1